jgi:cytochrome c oxidase subunit I
MTTAATILPQALPREHYLNATYGIRSWLLTTDHKRIALLYLASVTFFFMLGGIFAFIIRLHLLTPQGTLVSPETYNKLFTMHGVAMIFFFLVPSIPSVLGNFLIPLMIGAKDLAFPKVNLLSWYLNIIGGCFVLYSFSTGGLDTGWTFYTPLSSIYSNSAVTPAIIGIFVNGFSSILTGLNFIVTIHTMRAPGLTWFRLPLFVWSLYATSIIFILATPVVAIALSLVALERVFHLGFFNPALGGDPILFQHLFWFYSHPVVYIMVLPAMGVVSELIATFARKPVFGYKFVAGSSIAIAVLGFLVWGHHMFVSGQSTYSAMAFSLLSYLVAIPSAVKVFNWTSTLYKGSLSYDAPMLYALGTVGLFTIGGLTGLILASLGLDMHVHDTYFVVAHFHYIMVGASVMGYLGGIHYWWPKISGKLYPESLSQIAAIVLFVGFNLTFFPQFILGYLGMPRRYHSYPPELQVLNVMSTAGATILAVGYLLPIIYLTWSIRYGRVAGPNPWPATGMEWQTPSPPPTENFDVTPEVTWEPYDFLHGPDLGLASDISTSH